MDDRTEKKVARIIEALAGVKSYRCLYRDLSFAQDIDSHRVVQIHGDSDGRVRLSTLSGYPKVETVIGPAFLMRVDLSSKTSYRIDFTRHPFSDFHRYGWLQVNRPFTLLETESIDFRAEIAEAPGTLVFQGSLAHALLPRFGEPQEPPLAQVTLDAHSGLLRELLIVSGGAPQRFVFSDYAVNRRLRKNAFLLEPAWEVGDMTELYWSQILAAQDKHEPPLFNWN